VPLCEVGAELSRCWDIFEGMPTSATDSLTVNLASKKQGACAIAQAVSGRPVTAEACVPSQVTPCCGFVVDKLAVWLALLRVCGCSCDFIVGYSLIRLPLMLYTLLSAIDSIVK
jgi:hypothetical protein